MGGSLVRTASGGSTWHVDLMGYVDLTGGLGARVSDAGALELVVSPCTLMVKTSYEGPPPSQATM